MISITHHLKFAIAVYAGLSAAAFSQTVVEYNIQGETPGAPGGRFFYSADPAEQAYVDSGGAGPFKRTGNRFAVGGNTPVCRFYGSVQPGPNSHFYTVDPGECNALKVAQISPKPTKTQQWNFEGNGFNTTGTSGAAKSCPAGTVPVSRAYNEAYPVAGGKNAWDSNHRYSTSGGDIDYLVNGKNWRSEGTVFCATAALPELGIVPQSRVANQCNSVETQKAWVRAFSDENYLWYNEIPRVAAAHYATPERYFEDLRTFAKTDSGKWRDQFHFTLTDAQWAAFQNSDGGLGYGLELEVISNSVPRKAIVKFTEPGNPAAQAGIKRGWELRTADGVDFVQGGNAAMINAALFPSTRGESHTFGFFDPATQSVKTVALTATSVVNVPVNLVKVLPTSTGNVGYILFNDFALAGEGQLIAATTQLRAAGVTDLVLDLRYNGGGYLYIASQLGYMIAGSATTNKLFEKTVYSDKRVADNNDPDNSLPFFDLTSGFPGTGTLADVAIPTLNLRRVYILTSDGSASASEAVINSLRGIDVNVVLVGSTTTGKPYGFLPTSNCGTTYFTIEFKGINAKGFGDYPDGFAPTCQVIADDFSHALGDPAESRLAAALSHRATGRCPAGTLPGDALKSAPSTQVSTPPSRMFGRIKAPAMTRGLVGASVVSVEPTR